MTYIKTSEKTKAIRKALSDVYGYKNVSVTKSTGTASHWITIKVKIQKPKDCRCKGWTLDKCASCKGVCVVTREKVEKMSVLALKEIGTEFDTYCSDYGYNTERTCNHITIKFIK